MAGVARVRVAVLWRGNEQARLTGVGSNERLRPVVEALRREGANVEIAVYRDAIVDEIREQLLGVDAVLVWADPIDGREDRSVLDSLLREVAAHGVIVSAHPDVIAAMGTKEVLFTTRELEWGSETLRYADPADFGDRFPDVLARGPRVLKQVRGNGGIGVWRVDVVERGHRTPPGPDTVVRVQHAQIRDTSSEELRLGVFMDRCRQYFVGGRPLIDQAFQPRVAEGLIRSYLVVDEVVGFARQSPDHAVSRNAPEQIMGLPSPKTMYPPTAPQFARLRSRLQAEWVPAMQAIVGVCTADLPLLWDADFLLGPPLADGTDSYVLCEINASSVTPFPPEAVTTLSRVALERIRTR